MFAQNESSACTENKLLHLVDLWAHTDSVWITTTQRSMVSISICSLFLLAASSTVLFCVVYMPSAVHPLSSTMSVFVLSVFLLLPPTPHKAMLSTVPFCRIYRPVSHSSRSQNSICDSAGAAACCDQLQFSGQQSLYRTRSCWALVSHQSTYLQIFYSIFCSR